MPNIHTSLLAFRRNWPILSVAMFVVGILVFLGFFLFIRGGTLMERQLKNQLQATAAVAAMQFPPAIIQDITERGTGASGYPEAVARLRTIRQAVPAIRFVYVMRKTDDPKTLAFVADADGLATSVELDTNHNGLVEQSEEGSQPGDLYDTVGVPALQGPAFEGPTVDDDFTYDKWGTTMSGYAPIRDANGATIAVLGIDMSAEDYISLSRSVFSPMAFLLLVFAAFFIAAVVAGYMLRRRAEALRRIERERSGLLLLAMHQIGSPLTIIRWSLEELLEQTGKNSLEQAVQDHAKNVTSAAEFLDRILIELREASDVDTGTLAYTREWVALHGVVASVVSDFQAEWKLKNQTIDIAVDPGLSFSFDRTLIAGVLRELVRNAITFSPEGSTITIAAKRGASSVLVEVIDRGCGIAKTDLPRMFEKFTRGARAHLYQPNGSGLGLYIAKGIVTRAGGDIWIKSKEGQGTTVAFTLPC
ncbi:MAG: HAMP domain-containing histidine kinase [Candidatus Peribacteraceae bacterium]|nr:HAMP domain-containing histidine kinase [Candidatus Peribacteraceae bacterium]